MKIYESDIPFDECVRTMQNVKAVQDGDVEFAIQENKVEINVKYITEVLQFWRIWYPSQRRRIKIPVIFYGKLSGSKTHTTLSGSFAIASAWKAICIVFSFVALFSAGALLGHIIFGQTPFANDIKRELLSNYGLALFIFLTIPLIKLTIARNDEKAITIFLEKNLSFRLKKEIHEFSKSDIVAIYALLIAHTLGFVLTKFF